jgi:DNA-binding LytR/AlgR family response regulator
VHTKIPAYLYEKANIIRLVLLTALFALFFINVFQPFGSREWYAEINDLKYFFFSSLIILTGMLVVVVSRWLMYRFSKKHELVYWQYFAWIAVEILTMALFYSLFIYFLIEQNNNDFATIMRESTANTAWILLLPYAILWLYFAFKEKKRLLEQLDAAQHHQEQSETQAKKHLIAFPDEKGELRISLMLENLLYIESADNYVTIFYLNKSKLSHYLLRNSLKWIDENLTQETALVRCHRSCIVNLDNVKVLQKTKNGIFLELDAINTPDIPVSKTYYNQVMEKFSKYSV